MYLPYDCMDLSEKVKLIKGKFIQLEDWTVDNVLHLIDFKPRTIFGNSVIKSYHEEEVPKFINHIRESDP